MEAIRSRSESPFSKNKTKSHLSDAPENGSTITEQVKTKKKSLRTKCRSQLNGKEYENAANNGKEYFEEEKAAASEIDSNMDSNNTEHENGIDNGGSTENGNGVPIPEVNDNKENDGLGTAMEEKIVNENNSNIVESEVEERKSIEGSTGHTEEDSTGHTEEDSTEHSCNVTETESCAKNDNSNVYDLPPQSDVCESTGNYNEGTNEIFNGNTNSFNKEQEDALECSDIKEPSQSNLNGCEVSSQEDSNTTEDHIQASPDTATTDDNSISNKITNFLGKWTYSQEQKQDPEVSSSKKIEGTAVNHPYLSKVSGRRGIKDRLNMSATVFSSKEMEAKTPEHSGISLDDSFRVRTNPPRLTSELNENPTLRKFKGKRCLNVGDEPGDEDEACLNTMKRRKVEEKAEETGLLASILWTPFKKKSLDNGDELKLRTTESKLTRLLSPFWFWKKTAEGQNRK